MRIIELSGQMGVGKDFIANKLSSIITAQGNKVERLAFADPLRAEIDVIIRLLKVGESPEEIADSLHVQAEQIEFMQYLLTRDEKYNDETFSIKNRPACYREVLQYWGTDVRRKQDKNFWVKKVVQTIKEDTPFVDVFIVTDARFANEIHAILQFPYAFTVRLIASADDREERVLSRDGDEPTHEELTHISEMAINDDDTDMMKNFDAIYSATGNNGEQIAKDIAKEYLIDPPFDNNDEVFE